MRAGGRRGGGGRSGCEECINRVSEGRCEGRVREFAVACEGPGMRAMRGMKRGSLLGSLKFFGIKGGLRRGL